MTLRHARTAHAQPLFSPGYVNEEQAVQSTREVLRNVCGFLHARDVKTSSGDMRSCLESPERIGEALGEHQIVFEYLKAKLFTPGEQMGSQFDGYIAAQEGPTRELLERTKKVIDAIKTSNESNEFAAYKRAKGVATTVVYEGGVFESYGGKKPYEIAFTSDGYYACSVIHADPEIGEFIIGKGGNRNYGTEFMQIAGRQQLDAKLGDLILEDTRNSESMWDKCPWWDTPWEGLKSEFVLNPDRMTEDQMFADWAVSSLTAGVLGFKACAGPDMWITSKQMSLIDATALAAARDLGADIIRPCTGREKKDGGFPHKEWEVTGWGVVQTLLATLEHKGVNARMEDVSVIIQGFGDVGGSVARILLEELNQKLGYRFKIVGVSDIVGGIYDENGLDASELMRVKRQLDGSREGGRSIVRYFDRSKLGAGARILEGEQRDELMLQKARVLVPAAGQDAITAANAGRLQVEMIVEGANNAIAPGVENVLHGRGILYVPGMAANGGGVYSSTDEVFHNYTEGKQELSTRPEFFRTHVLDGIRELALTNTRWLLEEAERRGKTPLMVLRETSAAIRDAYKRSVVSLAEPYRRITERVGELTESQDGRIDGEAQRIASERSLPAEEARRRAVSSIAMGEEIEGMHVGEGTGDAVNASILKRAQLDVERGIPMKLAIKIACSETAREGVIYGGRTAVPELILKLHRGDDEERRAAAYMLGKIRDPNATIMLIDAFAEDEYDEVRKNIAEALGNIGGGREIVGVLRVGLNDRSDKVRVWSRWALEKLGEFGGISHEG